MAWVRWGDASAMHPMVLAILELESCDDRLVNEVMGFVSRCACQSGAHTTDYVVSRGTAIQIGGPTRVDTLVAACLAAGLFTEIDFDKDGRTVHAYKLCDDDPEFLHLRLKAEIDWERQRRADNSRPSLTVPVRLRDGDACRWCGVIVDWSERRSARSGTYDHLEPGEPATVETYVVACKRCNSSRGDGALPDGVTALMDPPDKPYFSAFSVEQMRNNKWRQHQNLPVPVASHPVIPIGNRVDGSQPPRTRTGSPESVAPSAPSGQRRVAPSAPADDQCRVAPSAPTDRDPAQQVVAPSAPSHAPTQSYVAPSAPADGNRSADDLRISADSAEGQGAGSVSTGRVGPGRVGSGLEPHSPKRDPSARRRGGRRGRKPSKGM